ncbi:FAD-linked oxidoreductase-like protein [Phycomyces nitens]|nr:FAD-linked oxidoreductase-like protein [Phycomyces nitens]
MPPKFPFCTLLRPRTIYCETHGLPRLKRYSTFKGPQRPLGLKRTTAWGALALTAFSAHQIYKPQESSPPYSVHKPQESLQKVPKQQQLLMDTQSQAALSQKTTKDLVLTLVVYQLCSYPWLVQAAPFLINLGKSVGLEVPVYWIIKHTFFRQFCGGETAEECRPIMERLEQAGIHSILDLSMESDIKGTNETKEDRGDALAEMIKHGIRTISPRCPSPKISAFTAIKISGLTSPELLLTINRVLTSLQTQFDAHQVNGCLSADRLDQIIKDHLPRPKSDHQRMERKRLVGQLETVDQVQFDSLFDLQGPNREIWWTCSAGDKGFLSAQEWKEYDGVVNRLEDICGLAKDLGVGIMIDAEQSYFQEAIDHFGLHLQQKFNRIKTESEALVYNTYQMYTKSGQRKLERDTRRAEQQEFTLAIKLVRGAYMVSELKRAKDMGYPSPIQDTLEDTHTSFNGAILFLLNKLQEYDRSTDQTLSPTTAPVVFMVASHNRESVVLTVQEMDRHSLSPQSRVIQFGQLYGMQDQMSYILGKYGYSIYKYLPYGKIDQVLPYLVRRAQENSAIFESVSTEQRLLLQEIKRRVFNGKQRDE